MRFSRTDKSLVCLFSRGLFLGVFGLLVGSVGATQKQDLAKAVAVEMNALKKHWGPDKKKEFFEAAFPDASNKDRDYLVSKWDEQTQSSKEFPFPKITSVGDKVVIGDEGQIKISLLNAEKGEVLINGLPFLYNPKMGLRYQFKVMEKHLETVAASTSSFFDLLIVPQAHAGLFEGGMFQGGVWRTIGEIAVVGFTVYGVGTMLKNVGFFEKSPHEKIQDARAEIREAQAEIRGKKKGH